MVQAHCRNGQKTTSHLRFLICGVVCYGVLAPTITSALGEYDVLRQIAAQERLEQPRRGDGGGGYGGGGGGYDDSRGPYELRSYLDPDMLTGGGGDMIATNGMDSDYAGDSDGLGGVDRLESYMDKFLGLDSVGGGQELLDEAVSDEIPKIRFPKLTSEQKKFGIHPGYLSYYNRELQHIEDELEKRKGGRDRSSGSGGNVNGDEIADDPFDSAEPKEKSGGEKGLTFGKVRQEPKGTISEEDNSVADQVLKKADSDGGVIITGLGGSGDGFGDGSGGLQIGDVSFTVIVAVCSAVAAFTIVLAGIVYHRLQRNTKAAEDVEYPAYGVTAAAAGGQLGRTGSGSAGSPTSGGSLSGDRKLAQNAQMYHYQHQKQQMIAFDSHQNGGTRNRFGSEDNDSDEGEEGDYTVYECPGLAPTGEMEVRNPMFSDDQTTPKANGK